MQFKLSNTGMNYKYLAGYLLYQVGFEVTKVTMTKFIRQITLDRHMGIQ